MRDVVGWFSGCWSGCHPGRRRLWRWRRRRRDRQRDHRRPETTSAPATTAAGGGGENELQLIASGTAWDTTSLDMTGPRSASR